MFQDSKELMNDSFTSWAQDQYVREKLERTGEGGNRPPAAPHETLDSDTCHPGEGGHNSVTCTGTAPAALLCPCPLLTSLCLPVSSSSPFSFPVAVRPSASFSPRLPFQPALLLLYFSLSLLCLLLISLPLCFSLHVSYCVCVSASLHLFGHL